MERSREPISNRDAGTGDIRRKDVRGGVGSGPRVRSEPAQRRARARVGESEGHSPSDEKWRVAMTPRSMGRVVLPVLICASVVSGYAVARESGNAGRASVRIAADSESAAASLSSAEQKGRYKKQGDNCVWDANDEGPNQCTPPAKGRFKKEGDNCRWDANDTGDDQCRPKTGRFKQEGNRCVWSPNDSGPDQCNPRQPR